MFLNGGKNLSKEISMSKNLSIGSEVPNFSGQTKSGLLQLSDLRGKNVVIYFYPKDNTPGCTKESKDFRDYYDDFSNENTEIIGISRDDIKSHCIFIDNHDLNFSLISDENESLCHLFDVLKEKSMFGKKYKGIERSTFLIDKNGILQHEWRNVSILGHAKKVLSEVKKLNGGKESLASVT